MFLLRFLFAPSLIRDEFSQREPPLLGLAKARRRCACIYARMWPLAWLSLSCSFEEQAHAGCFRQPEFAWKVAILLNFSKHITQALDWCVRIPHHTKKVRLDQFAMESTRFNVIVLIFYCDCMSRYRYLSCQPLPHDSNPNWLFK